MFAITSTIPKGVVRYNILKCFLPGHIGASIFLVIICHDIVADIVTKQNDIVHVIVTYVCDNINDTYL